MNVDASALTSLLLRAMSERGGQFNIQVQNASVCANEAADSKFTKVDGEQTSLGWSGPLISPHVDCTHEPTTSQSIRKYIQHICMHIPMSIYMDESMTS
jgi:hypothetical protein